MEAIQVQAAVQQAAGTSGTRSFMVGAPSQTGGGFLELMMQLLGGMGGTLTQGEQPTDDEMLEALDEQMKKDGSMMGMQMLTEMLMASQMQAVALAGATLAQIPDGATQPMSAAGTNVGDLLDILTGQNQNTALPQGLPKEQGALQAAQQQGSYAEMLAASVQSGEASAKAGTQGDTQQGFGGQAQFQQAVMQAQKLLQAARQSEPTAEVQPVDIDALQNKVDASKAAHGAAQQPIPVQTAETGEVRAPELPDVRDLMSQVKTGILSGMQNGKNEFVIKLKPEGLGEITVKLTELGSRMSLSITTSTAQTQRMITGEMAGLRETMRPLGVEVQPVVSQEAGHFNAQQQSNFGGHQHQQFTEEQNRQPLYNDWRGEPAPQENPAVIWKSPAMSAALDTYI